MNGSLKALAQGFLYATLFLVAIGLVFAGRAGGARFEDVRMRALDAVTPLLDVVSRPIEATETLVERVRSWLTLEQENQRLRLERDRLLEWQTVARALEAENADLRHLVNAAPEPARRFVSARVAADLSGAYARSLLIFAGSDAGIKKGDIAITGAGLVGRAISVSSRSARILLVTDLNSRVPVYVGTAQVRAVLAGDNSGTPRLTHMIPHGSVEVGDEIITSGIAGGYPQGVPVGVVAAVDGGDVRTRLYADLDRLNFVRLVDFSLPTPPVSSDAAVPPVPAPPSSAASSAASQ